MDLFGEGLAFARTRTSCALVRGNLKQSGFGVPFDVIGAFDVVEHLSNDLQVFRSLRSMLRPAGVLLLTVPAHQSLWSYFDEASHHCPRYEPAELRRKLNQCGYEIEFLSQFMASIYPLLWLAVINRQPLAGRMLWRLDRGSYPRTEEDLRERVESRFKIIHWEKSAIYYEYVFGIGVREF